ncbi:MAG: ATP-binding protein [Opitutae bacterium]|nr:ATP-binding protein [Opitutae bacterium]
MQNLRQSSRKFHNMLITCGIKMTLPILKCLQSQSAANITYLNEQAFRVTVFLALGKEVFLQYEVDIDPSSLKAPIFEASDLILDNEGLVLRCGQDLADWLGLSTKEMQGQAFHLVLRNYQPDWEPLLSKGFHKSEEPIHLPLYENGLVSGTGINLRITPFDEISFISVVPGLSPHDELKKSFFGDIPLNTQVFGRMFLRLQAAEGRLADYMSNFPGIFFTQRPDLSFNYLSKGIKNLFPNDWEGFYKNSGLFLSFMFEQDREYFHQQLSDHQGHSETFTLNYRVKLPPGGQLVYLMDVRTPKITTNGKLLGYDGVFLDVTRQAIAEHRLSHAVWREGLSTLTNGLVHDFSNVMGGIYSLSELYHGMMESDDPMAKGMDQIKRSAMDAQKLVRRIIDLHRETSTYRSLHDLRFLLKDQVDLIKIIISRGARLEVENKGGPLPAFVEENGFRQTVLNLCINARDAIKRGGKVKVRLRRVRKGEPIMEGAFPTIQRAPRPGAEITITDDGAGIPENHKEKIFDPFFTTKDSESGSGFGLYNAKLYVEDHKGRLGFKSIPGKGTSFYIYLPLAEEDTASDSGLSKQRRKSSRRSTRGLLPRPSAKS